MLRTENPLLLLFFVIVSEFVTGQETPKIDCHPDVGVTQYSCESRGCIWIDEWGADAAPHCVLPSKTGYLVTEKGIDEKNNTQVNITKDSDSIKCPYGKDVKFLSVKVIQVSGSVNVRIYDPNNKRYEPPLDLPRDFLDSSENLTFSSTNVSDLFSFKITRVRTGSAIWDTSLGGLLFADQFIQIATYLPTKNIYGFGEHVHKNLKHNLTKYTTWPMFARDDAPDSVSELNTKNYYGVHPFYLGIEDSGITHGVLLLNSNAQEVTLGPGPSLVYRTIGGILDIFFFPGPTPDDVINQYLKLIGTPALPPYWALGYQLSRYGYTGLDDMKAAVERTRNAHIPLDIVYADIDYMDGYKDFTEGWTGLDEYAKYLHSEGLHLALIFDPAIEVNYTSFNNSEYYNISYIEWPSSDYVPDIENNYTMIQNKKIMLGNVWPKGNVAFPDFLDTENKTQQWWTDELKMFHDKCPFDVTWIDMNEPSNFETSIYYPEGGRRPSKEITLYCPLGENYTLDDPPYATRVVYYRESEYLCSKTVCMIGRTGRNTYNFYDTKNLYGWSESKASAAAYQSLKPGERPVVISRSTFVSSGRYAGHWLGDNSATWEDLKTSIIGTIEFNMFGIPYVGADICGFNGNTTEELCLRWHQAAAFYPFCRNHNTKGAIPQDPAQWESVSNAALQALTLRYRLLPHLYSLMYRAAVDGAMVVRPIFFSYPKDEYALEISDQFMWGDSLMFAPVVVENTTSRDVYFPSGYWYSIRSTDYGQLIAGSLEGSWKSVNAPLNWNTPAFLLGGKIVPTQIPAVTTTESRSNPFGLIIAMETTRATWNYATGRLYWDDGLSSDLKGYYWKFDFRTTPTTATLAITLLYKTDTTDDGSPLTSPAKTKATFDLPKLETIDLIGYDFAIDNATMTLNGTNIPTGACQISVNRTAKTVQMTINDLIFLAEDTVVLIWKHAPYNDSGETTSTTSTTVPTKPNANTTESTAVTTKSEPDRTESTGTTRTPTTIMPTVTITSSGLRKLPEKPLVAAMKYMLMIFLSLRPFYSL